MLPIRWDPVKELSNLQREMDSLFRRTLGPVGLESEAGVEAGQWMAPLVDTFVKGKTYHIKAELPGVSQNDIDVSVEGNVLTLKGERKFEKETGEKDYHLHETRFGSFIRRLSLPEGAQTDAIHASYDNGILAIEVPLKEKLVTGRKIAIEGPESGKKQKKIH